MEKKNICVRTEDKARCQNMHFGIQLPPLLLQKGAYSLFLTDFFLLEAGGSHIPVLGAQGFLCLLGT